MGGAAAVSLPGLCAGRAWKVPWVCQGPARGQKTPMCPQRRRHEQYFLRTESQDGNTRYTGSCPRPGPGQQEERLVSETGDAGRPQAPRAGTQTPQWKVLAREGEEGRARNSVLCALESCELAAAAVSGARCSRRVRKRGRVTGTALGHRQDEAGPPLLPPPPGLRVSSGTPAGRAPPSQN